MSSSSEEEVSSPLTVSSEVESLLSAGVAEGSLRVLFLRVEEESFLLFWGWDLGAVLGVAPVGDGREVEGVALVSPEGREVEGAVEGVAWVSLEGREVERVSLCAFVLRLILFCFFRRVFITCVAIPSTISAVSSKVSLVWPRAVDTPVTTATTINLRSSSFIIKTSGGYSGEGDGGVCILGVGVGAFLFLLFVLAELGVVGGTGFAD